MKKLFLLILAIVPISFLKAVPVDNTGVIMGKVHTEGNKGYFILSDGTFWKAFSFTTRSRGPLEWLTGVELIVPDSYKCGLSEWVLGTEVDACPKYFTLTVDESNASNQEDLKTCSHLLINKKSGKMLFAVPLHPVDCMDQIFQDGHTQGYAEGHTKGYNSGYSLGYSLGYSAGESAAQTHNE